MRLVGKLQGVQARDEAAILEATGQSVVAEVSDQADPTVQAGIPLSIAPYEASIGQHFTVDARAPGFMLSQGLILLILRLPILAAVNDLTGAALPDIVSAQPCT